MWHSHLVVCVIKFWGHASVGGKRCAFAAALPFSPRGRLTALLPLCAALSVAALVLQGCAGGGGPESKKFDAAEAPSMSLAQAKQTIQRWSRWYWSDAAADHHYIAPQFEPKQLVLMAYYPTTNKKRKFPMCDYENFEPVLGTYQNLSAGAHKGSAAHWTKIAPDGAEHCKTTYQIPTPTEEAAKEVAAAIQRWKNSTFEERQAFTAQESRVPSSMIESYANARIKPVLPEQVRRFRVVAELAVREKRFADAATAYEKGLELAPWWAQGHFDAALILAEIYYYKDAINHMRQYLALSPDAKDARAVQDKIYEWEDSFNSAEG
jgi:tetratricopeptide (TPR) repeat protein